MRTWTTLAAEISMAVTGVMMIVLMFAVALR